MLTAALPKNYRLYGVLLYTLVTFFLQISQIHASCCNKTETKIVLDYTLREIIGSMLF